MHKNENRPGYKKTKVGWIPEGWGVNALQDISKLITKGSTPTTYGFAWAEPSPDAIPFLRSECVSANGFIESGLQYISDAAHASLSRSEVKPEDILMTITGNVGRVIRFPTKFRRANINQHIARIRVNSAAARNEFVFQSLELPFYSKHYQSIVTGQAYPQISLVQVRETPIPFPGLPEQEAIAEVLECWDRGIRNLELKIVKKRRIKKGLMQQLLSGKRRLPGFGAECRMVNGECRIPKDWKTVRLGKISAIRKGQQLSRIDQTETGEYPVLNGGVEPLGYTDKWNTEGNTITISEGGNSCGFVNFNAEKFWCGGHCYALAEDESKAVKPYLFQVLKHKQIPIMRLRVGSGLPNIQKKALEHFEIAIPPLEEQRVIAKVLAAADGEIEALDRKLALWKDQKKYLLQNLVTGTIRLPAFVKE